MASDAFLMVLLRDKFPSNQKYINMITNTIILINSKWLQIGEVKSYENDMTILQKQK